MYKLRNEFTSSLRNATNLHVTEVKLNTLYKVAFNVDAVNYNLEISIPESFPNERLKVVLSPPAKHPILNDKCEVVGSPALNGVTLNSNLAHVIYDTIEDLKRPKPLPLPAGYNRSSQSEPVMAAALLAASAPAASSLETSKPREQPSLAEQYLPCEYLEKEYSDLNYISTQEEEMLELQLKSPKTKEMNDRLSQLVSQTEEVAKHNMSLESVLCERSGQLVGCVQEIERLSKDVSELQYKLQTVIDSLGPESHYYNLQVAVLQADEECEKLTRDLFSGQNDLPLETFIERYKAKRYLYHLRKAKQEQFARIMLENPSTSS